MVVNKNKDTVRNNLILQTEKKIELVMDICSILISIPTENPPSDTNLIIKTVEKILKDTGAKISIHEKTSPVKNIVARIEGKKTGKRLVFNGHLDTFPIIDKSLWHKNPFSPFIKNNHLYGKGVADMKGGVACSIFAFMMLSYFKEFWRGEIVLVLVGGEESGGRLGTEYVLDTVPEASGDAMIKGDAGSPIHLMFGEKGLLWVELISTGKSSHGAHIEQSNNAIHKLIKVLSELRDEIKFISITNSNNTKYGLENHTFFDCEKNKIKVMQDITMNVSTFNGGTLPNLTPDKASSKIDIRLPIGVSTKDVIKKIDNIINNKKDVYYNVIEKIEPNYSNIDDKIFEFISKCTNEIFNKKSTFTIRNGSSDACMYRERGIPSVNCGLTPYNMGGENENININELKNVARIHTLTAFDYLSS